MSNTSRKSVDLATKPLTTISGHEQSISSIAYLPGGERVVSCSDDKTVRIWGVGNAEQEGTSMEHEDQLYALAVTRDGKRILSGGDDRRIKVWDAETHELIEEWESPEDGILSIALSPDDRLVANGDGKGKIVIREMKEGGEIKHSIEAGSSVTSVYSLCFSPNGEKLACAVNKQTPRDVRGGVGDYTIQVYDIESGELILGPIIGHEDWVRSVLWSLDGIQLFSGSDDHSIRCWDSDTGEPIGELWTGHTDQVNSLSLSFDGTKLASSSSDRTVRFWDAHSGDPIGQPLHHDNHLWAVALSPSGEFVASGGMDEKISIWRVPWWDDSKKEPHKSFLDLPAVPVFKNDQQQNGLDFLDLPTSRRPFTSSHRPPTDSTTTLTVKRVQRFWRGLVARRTSSSPQQGIELNEMQDRRFWKSPVRTPVTEVAAGRLTDRVKVGRREPRRKKKKDEKSRKPKKSQAHTSSSAAEAGPSSNAEQSGSTSNAGPSNSQAGPSTASNTAPVGRSSSFAQSNTGSDDSWDDMDCGEQCVDYFCFGPRENRERFRPWKKKTRAVIEAEERAKKEKRKKNTRKHRKSKTPKSQNAARPPHHLDPQRDNIQEASPASHHAHNTTLERPGNHSQPDGVVSQAVLPLEEQIEQLRRQLDDAVGAKRKADADRGLLEQEVKELRSTAHDFHKSLDYTSSSAGEAGPSSSFARPTSNAGSSASQAQTQNTVRQAHHQEEHTKVASASHDVDDLTREPLEGDHQLDGAVPQFALELQEQMDQLRQQVDDLVAAKRKAEADLLEMGVKESHKLQEHTRLPAGPLSLANPSGSMSNAGPSTL